MTTMTRRPPVEPELLCALHALADENRLAVLEALRGGERCVCELQASLELSQPLLSHHLRVLREAGLVQSRREGRWIHYSIVPAALRSIEEHLASIRGDARRAPARGSVCV